MRKFSFKFCQYLHTFNLDKKINEICTRFCKEAKHNNILEFFLKHIINYVVLHT